jgi:ribulose-5-phosphate 4-epimerase/fuculose-1-phosphate aldolase
MTRAMTKLKTQRIRQMVALSRRLGTDPLLVQAAGGNVSAKFGDGSMAVKTSVIRLREVRASKGWARANVSEIRQGAKRLKGKAGSPKIEMAYADLLRDSSGAAISMESGLHAVLPDIYVAHTHSVVGLVLGLMPARLAIGTVQKFCGNKLNVQILSPKLPGCELTQTMLKSKRHTNAPLSLWILQNHGLVWAGSSTEKIWFASAKLEKGLRALLKIQEYPHPHRLASKSCKERLPRSSMLHPLLSTDLCFCHWPVCTFDFRPLFPDLVIYFDLWSRKPGDVLRLGERSVRIFAKDKISARDKQEVFFAHVLASTLAMQKGWHKPLPRGMGLSIKNLETERRRLVQIKSH